jgi:hypothetical protein
MLDAQVKYIQKNKGTVSMCLGARQPGGQKPLARLGEKSLKARTQRGTIKVYSGGYQALQKVQLYC